MKKFGAVATLGLFVVLLARKSNAHVWENISLYGNKAMHPCISAGDSFDFALLYSVEGIKFEEFTFRRDVEFYLDQKLVGYVTTNRSGETFTHERISNLNQYPDLQQVVNFSVKSVRWTKRTKGYHFAIELTYTNVPESFNNILFELGNSKLVERVNSRTLASTGLFSHTVSNCKIPDNVRGTPTSLKYNEAGTYDCKELDKSFGPDSGIYQRKTFSCKSYCQVDPYPDCYQPYDPTFYKGMYIMNILTLSYGHVFETLGAAEYQPKNFKPFRCLTAGSSNAFNFEYVAEGIEVADFRNQTDFEIFLNKQLVGTVVTTRRNNDFAHEVISRMSLYPQWKAYHFWVEPRYFTAAVPGYRFYLHNEFENVPSSLNGVTLQISNLRFLTDYSLRQNITTPPVPLPVGECTKPDSVSGQESCTYDCTVDFVCLENNEPIKGKCVDNCVFELDKPCGKESLYSEGAGSSMIGIVVGVLVVLAIAAGLVALRFKTGKWPWDRTKAISRPVDEEAQQAI